MSQDDHVGNRADASVGDKGHTYADYIATELQAELVRKSTLGARATSVVTTSGGMVAILAAIGAFIGSQGGLALPWYGSLLILLALLTLAAASSSAIFAGWPTAYDTTSAGSMESMVYEQWDDDEEFARLASARIRVALIKTLREVNGRGAKWLLASWWCQTVALGLLATVVVIALWTS